MAAAARNWILIAEKLPPSYETVLVACEDNYYFAGYYAADVKEWRLQIGGTQNYLGETYAPIAWAKINFIQGS
jgi:hypothetical protein